MLTGVDRLLFDTNKTKLEAIQRIMRYRNIRYQDVPQYKVIRRGLYIWYNRLFIDMEHP